METTRNPQIARDETQRWLSRDAATTARIGRLIAEREEARDQGRDGAVADLSAEVARLANMTRTALKRAEVYALVYLGDLLAVLVDDLTATTLRPSPASVARLTLSRPAMVPYCAVEGCGRRDAHQVGECAP